MQERINMLNIQRELDKYGDEILHAVKKSFADTMFINGPRVKEFEKDAAAYLGVKHAIGVANGTEAIHIGLRALDISAGDEVITTAFTFFATAEACEYIGAKTVFADIDEATMNIDPAKIEALITPKTKAIVPVHIFGAAADMPSIMQIADKHGIKVLEDCAQSFGAEISGKKTGAIGTAGATSFYPTKNLGAYGDGGMITTNDDDVAQKVRVLREHGSSVRYHHDVIGYNSRLDDIQAAVLGAKLKHIDEFNKRRIELAGIYKKILGSAVGYQSAYADSKHVYHQFTIRVKNRDELIEALNKANIASSIFYPIPCHLQKSLAHLGYTKGSLPVSEKLSDEVLSIPMNPYLTNEEAEFIASVVLKTSKF